MSTPGLVVAVDVSIKRFGCAWCYNYCGDSLGAAADGNLKVLSPSPSPSERFFPPEVAAPLVNVGPSIRRRGRASKESLDANLLAYVHLLCKEVKAQVEWAEGDEFLLQNVGLTEPAPFEELRSVFESSNCVVDVPGLTGRGLRSSLSEVGFVVGWPESLRGGLGNEKEKRAAVAAVNFLSGASAKIVCLADERFTTKLALEEMDFFNVRKGTGGGEGRREDGWAAKKILENFLDGGEQEAEW